MLDSDWSRKFLLRSDWSGPKGALLTTVDDKMLLRITTLQNNLYFARVRLLRHTLPFFFIDFEKKKPTVLQSKE